MACKADVFEVVVLNVARESKQTTHVHESSTDKAEAAVMDPQRFLRWFGVMAKSNHRDCL
jgi:hypothetical protein